MSRAPLDPVFLTRPLAHRGYHDRAARRPENSRAAFAAAIAAGYGIELDLQPSADGTPMVFHDYALGRLTHEDGPIRQHSAADLSRIALRDSDEGIPTLTEILTLVAGQVPLLVEIKDQDGAMGPHTGGFEDAVAQSLAGYKGPLAVMSFNPHAVRAFARAAPHIAVGLTTGSYDPHHYAPLPAATCDRLRHIPDFDAGLHSFISHESTDLTRPRVAGIARDAAILTWTIRSPEAEAIARQYAANITFEGFAPAF